MRTTHVPYLITWCLFVLDRFEPDFFFLLEGTDLLWILNSSCILMQSSCGLDQTILLYNETHNDAWICRHIYTEMIWSCYHIPVLKVLTYVLCCTYSEISVAWREFIFGIHIFNGGWSLFKKTYRISYGWFEKIYNIVKSTLSIQA